MILYLHMFAVAGRTGSSSHAPPLADTPSLPDTLVLDPGGDAFPVSARTSGAGRKPPSGKITE